MVDIKDRLITDELSHGTYGDGFIDDEPNQDYVRGRPSVRTSKKLGILGKFAAAIGLRSEAMAALEDNLKEADFSFSRRIGYLAVPVDSDSALKVMPGSIDIQGKKSDTAIEAAFDLGKHTFGNRMSVQGSEDFKLRAWAHAQIAGVELTNYEPPLERHKQALEEVHRLVQIQMKVHGIKSVRADGYMANRFGSARMGVAAAFGFIDEGEVPHIPTAAELALLAREGEKQKIALHLGKVLGRAMDLPIIVYSGMGGAAELAASGFIDEEPTHARAPARLQPKGP